MERLTRGKFHLLRLSGVYRVAGNAIPVLFTDFVFYLTVLLSTSFLHFPVCYHYYFILFRLRFQTYQLKIETAN